MGSLTFFPGFAIPALAFLERYFPFAVIVMPLASLIGIYLSVKYWNYIKSALSFGIFRGG